jgi:hypothetical protein
MAINVPKCCAESKVAHARARVTSGGDRLPLNIAMSINIALSLSLWAMIEWGVDTLL